MIRHITALGLAAASALLVSTDASAQSSVADRCYQYANEMVALGHRARLAKCPAHATQHMNWDGHHDWCTKQTPGRTRAAAEEWSAKFDGCAAQGGVDARAVAPAAPCAPMAGRYRGGATIAVSATSVRVTVGPNRPVATGKCQGNRLTVNFPDDATHSGTFDGRTISWSNRTTWVKE